MAAAIVIMVIIVHQISIAMKKTFLLTATLLAITASSSFADALLFTVSATPYDRQMARIRPVLTASSRAASNGVSLNVVNQWIGGLRSIPYGFTAVWKTPAEAQSGAPADCKAKAVALYDKMRANGATNVRLVIGKRTSTSRQTHAWLAWETQGDSYVQLGGVPDSPGGKKKLPTLVRLRWWEEVPRCFNARRSKLAG
jgi:predicted transglutaminase-like cysteine proteinase